MGERTRRGEEEREEGVSGKIVNVELEVMTGNHESRGENERIVGRK